MLKFFATHHNKIQFFGYEVANLLWVYHHVSRSGTPGYGLNAETCAALCFLTGSGLIWTFHPERRPQMLFHGGLCLTFGGLFLAIAGFAVTGLAVMLASLETARGGYNFLQAYAEDHPAGAAAAHRATLQLARITLGWYGRLVVFWTGRFPRLGRFIDQRPFITGAMIKAPLRLEFIAKKLLLGDWVGTLVGLSWMILGDIALAFNDAELYAYAMDDPETAELANSEPT